MGIKLCFRNQLELQNRLLRRKARALHTAADGFQLLGEQNRLILKIIQEV